MLAERGAEVNRKDNSGSTAVSSAVMGGRADVLDYLIQSGAEVDARMDDGDTPLIQAARWSNDACLEFLLAAGANPNRRAMNGRTALELAEDRDEGDPERAAIIARLIAAGGRRRP